MRFVIVLGLLDFFVFDGFMLVVFFYSKGLFLFVVGILGEMFRDLDELGVIFRKGVVLKSCFVGLYVWFIIL